MEKKNDMVNNPPHYAGGTSIECIDSMLAVLGVRGTIDFCLGNAYKYLWRHKLKGNPGEDLDKARWYVDKACVLNNSYLFEQEIEDKIEAVAALQGLYQCIYNGNKALHTEVSEYRKKRDQKEEEIDAILTTDDTHKILDCLENLTNGIDNEHYNADDHLKDIARIVNAIDKGRGRVPDC